MNKIPSNSEVDLAQSLQSLLVYCTEKGNLGCRSTKQCEEQRRGFTALMFHEAISRSQMLILRSLKDTTCKAEPGTMSVRHRMIDPGYLPFSLWPVRSASFPSLACLSLMTIC